jgi:hypothetical protein
MFIFVPPLANRLAADDSFAKLMARPQMWRVRLQQEPNAA